MGRKAMLIYIIAAIIILLLGILFRYLPSRVFIAFVVLLCILGGTIHQLQLRANAVSSPTQDELDARTHDQEVFGVWWEDYQREIAELDRKWILYHQILTDIKSGKVDLETTHARLSNLEREMQESYAEIEKHVPPTELSDYLYDLLTQMMNKTRVYAAAEQKAVTLTRAAADPALMKETNSAEQARLLELIMLRESPVALFIEDDISAIRNYFAPVSSAFLNEEGGKREGKL